VPGWRVGFAFSFVSAQRPSFNIFPKQSPTN
jgi:hypothetical protein